jgi:hypothetical protein
MLLENMSRKKCFFLVRVSHVLRFISICDLFTDKWVSYLYIHNPRCRIWGALSGGYVESSVFWGITPCRPLKFSWSFGRSCLLYLQVLRISQTRNHATGFHAGFLVYFLVLNMEACLSETSVEFQWNTLRYIPEYRSLHNTRCVSIEWVSRWTCQIYTMAAKFSRFKSIVLLSLEAI